MFLSILIMLSYGVLMIALLWPIDGYVDYAQSVLYRLIPGAW